MKKIFVSLILPVYNEEKSIANVVRDSVLFLESCTYVGQYEIISVNDGSSDQTLNILNDLQTEFCQLKVVTHNKNKGYGKALNVGITHAKGDVLILMDADGQFKVSEAEKMLKYLDCHDIVCGYRLIRNDSIYRKILGSLFNSVANFLFGLHLKDINCGLKVFKREIFEDEYITHAGLFCTEILLKAKAKNCKIFEVGVEHLPREGGHQTGASPKVLINSLIDIIRLKCEAISAARLKQAQLRSADGYKPKILFIITYLEMGGAQKHLLTLVEHLRKRNNVFIYTGEGGYLDGTFLRLGLPVRMDYSLKRNINPYFDLVSFVRMFFYIRKGHFDIVHTHCPKASLLGRWAAYLAGVRNIVYTVHGWSFHRFLDGITYHFYYFLEKLTAVITRKIIVVSKADFALAKKIKLDKDIKLIHYGVDINKFKLISSPSDNSNIVLTVSCLKKQKDILTFLRVAKNLLVINPDLNFLIAGDGPLRWETEEWIRDMGLSDKVKLLGWVGDIRPLLSQASMFVLTSLWEGLPIALIEAVVAGLPVVATNTGGVLDLITNGKQGFIVKPNNPEDAFGACAKIVKDIDAWRKIVRDNYSDINLDHWSNTRMLSAIDSLYDEVL